ncbi:MAG: UDP-N-acetylmuramoyl-L-alanine--D-glutamate ligase [Candidatus Melainabacteria bacterium]|nr:UDP-N-acetylmuramoyl-L-alanine--D-glutamate ligase [Candidatus Melainabacteria bacterium]
MALAKNWTGQAVTILGLSRSGVSAAKYLHRHGAACFLSEMLPASPGNESARNLLAELGIPFETGGHSEQCYTHASQVVVSPGIPPTSPVLQTLHQSGSQLMSEVELGYQCSRPTPIIGITGTNGKTTVTTLIGRILEASGRHAPTCGNIGRPVIDVIDEAEISQNAPDALVVELSSYQLAFSSTFRADIAVLTNFRPDHLDWHGSLEAYRNAKLSLFTGPRSPQWAIIPAQDPIGVDVERASHAKLLWFATDPDAVRQYTNKAFVTENGTLSVVWHDEQGQAQELNAGNVEKLKILGKHNQENALMAAAVAAIYGVPESVIAQQLQEFSGVPHRLELINTINASAFYNDSKATNVDSAISALTAFTHTPVVWIAGGRDKMTDLQPLIPILKQHAHAIVLLGEAKERFQKTFAQAGIHSIFNAQTLQEAVEIAFQQAQQNSLNKSLPILFSPACASFDMFTNFEVRGEAFKAAVFNLNQQLLAKHQGKALEHTAL